MGVTNFPDGINVGSDAGGTAVLQIGGAEVGVPVAQLRKTVGHVTAAGKLIAAGTVIVPNGGTAFATGLTAVDHVVATPYGPLASTAGTVGGFVGVTAHKAGGSVTLTGYDQMGTASLSSGTAAWLAIGT